QTSCSRTSSDNLLVGYKKTAPFQVNQVLFLSVNFWGAVQFATGFLLCQLPRINPDLLGKMELYLN
ncbi:MAG: hypothetical protein Q3962_00740, partial [Corynebacterium sp.]|nr:hypothetical protein [Corynebacterium sp.]